MKQYLSLRRLRTHISRASVFVGACLILMTSAIEAHSQPSDPESICPGLSPAPGQRATLYFKGHNGIIKPFSNAYLLEIVGRRVLFCYVVKRAEEDVPYGMPQRGAINVKAEVWQPNGSSQVLLFNNHQESPQACKERDFATYQSFHRFQADDVCLFYWFHNAPGDFPTTPESRRFAFVFPPLTVFESFLGPGERTPVKRMSQIYNYAIPQDFSLIRVPFYFTTGPRTTAVRVILDDLLEFRSGNPLDTIRVMIK